MLSSIRNNLKICEVWKKQSYTTVRGKVNSQQKKKNLIRNLETFQEVKMLALCLGTTSFQESKLLKSK